MNEQAQILKEEGNALYKKGNLELAIEKYSQASKRCPDDPVFQSNISAAYFELGRYEPCLQSIDLSLSVANSNIPLQAKLLLRKARCLLMLKRLEDSKQVIEQLVKVCEGNSLPIAEECKSIQKIIEESLLHKEYLLNSEVAHHHLLSLPKYRPASDTAALEYFVIGHDAASSLLSGSFNKRDSLTLGCEHRLMVSQVVPPVSVFFGGVGDGRHTFSTLVDIAEQMKGMKDFSKFSVHFTMIDIKAAAIARNLVILNLVDKLSAIKNKESEEAIKLMAKMQYILLAAVIPSYACDLLQETILEVETTIRANALPPYIYIQQSSVPQILKVLNYWKNVSFTSWQFIENINKKQEEIDRAMNEVKGSKDMLRNMGDRAGFFEEQDTASQIPDSEIEKMGVPGNTIAEKRKLINQLLSSDSAKRFQMNSDNMPVAQESAIYDQLKFMIPPIPLMDAHPVMAKLRTDKINDTDFGALQEHINSDFKANPTFVDEEWVNFVGLSLTGDSPYQAYAGYIGDVVERKPGKNTLFDFMKAYFIKVANALSATKQYIKLEWMVGELCNIAQSLPFDQERLKLNFPITFDRILLSNIPDYTGGTLFVALYIMPILKGVYYSSVKFTVLLNSGRFKDYTEYSKTYTLLPTLDSHGSFLGVKHQLGDIWEQDPRWTSLKLPLPTSQLASYDAVILWLIQMFFFIVLPVERAHTSFRIEFPLNLLSFIELIKRLVAMGYPAHWFSTLLANLLSGEISTSARPPPVYKSKVSKIWVKPFLPDLELAVAVYQPILPFVITSPTRPDLNNLKKYSIKLSKLGPFGPPKSSVLGLRFAPESYTFNLPQSLKQDIEDKYKPECYMMSIFEWDSKSLIATFWCNPKLMNDMIREDWYVTPVRTDNWAPDRSVPLKNGREEKKWKKRPVFRR
eukprot:TRINITY_DN4070_c0_g2_i2.p1 TRINITY_DN4070_c0_g2~~TRINITY_DN4070_c0_g2_i2.p1  ORF type:complete len:912 (-),score=197.45 TRINITY_DN4070_c0_g2_i2:22-2757(-)